MHQYVEEKAPFGWICKDESVTLAYYELMPKVTNILGNNKVSAWESRDFVLIKKLCQNFEF